MAQPATRIGDADVSHCSGMVRAKGASTVFVNNIPWSRQGDVNVEGKGAGRIGDAISGCTSVAAGSPNVFAGGGPRGLPPVVEFVLSYLEKLI